MNITKTHWCAFRIDRQRLWDRAVKFAIWQHPAVGRAARFAVPTSACLVVVMIGGSVVVPVIDVSRAVAKGDGLQRATVNCPTTFRVSTKNCEADLAVTVTGDYITNKHTHKLICCISGVTISTVSYLYLTCISAVPRLYLSWISPVFQLCLTCISRISQLYLSCISPVRPHLYFTCKSLVSLVYLMWTLGVSHLYLTCVSPVSNLYLTYVSPICYLYFTCEISYLYLTSISPISHLYLRRVLTETVVFQRLTTLYSKFRSLFAAVHRRALTSSTSLQLQVINNHWVVNLNLPPLDQCM